MNTPRTTLYRDKQNGKLMGVCSGIADYTGVNALWIRLAFIAAILTGVMGTIAIPLYVILSLIHI